MAEGTSETTTTGGDKRRLHQRQTHSSLVKILRVHVSRLPKLERLLRNSADAKQSNENSTCCTHMYPYPFSLLQTLSCLHTCHGSSISIATYMYHMTQRWENIWLLSNSIYWQATCGKYVQASIKLCGKVREQLGLSRESETAAGKEVEGKRS